MDKLKMIPLALVCSLSVKAVILGIGLSDASIAVALVGLLSIREYLDGNRKHSELANETTKKLQEMSEAIAKQNQVIKLQAEEYDKLRNSMSGIKLQYGVKDQFSQPKKLG